MYHRTLRWYNHITTLKRFKDFPDCEQIDTSTLCALSSKQVSVKDKKSSIQSVL